MKIEYYIKNIYGNETMYLVDSKEKKLIYALTNRITITKKDKHNLEEYGFIFIRVLK